jgi:hypothetical protein
MAAAWKKLSPAVSVLILLALLSTPSFATEDMVYGPKDFTISRWLIHLSHHTFSVDGPGEGRLFVSKKSPDKRIEGGFVLLNDQLFGLHDFLLGKDESMEREVALRTTNYLIVFLRGTPGATLSLEVRKGATTPPPQVSFQAEPQAIDLGETSTLSWTTAHADRAVLEPGIGSVAVSGTWQVQPQETTTYTMTVTGSGGVATATTTVTVVFPITIEITEPLEGTVIFRPDVMVRGIVQNAGGAEVGVNVNGVLALVEGNQFVANHVSLEEGENTILAVATTQGGERASTQIMVHGNRHGDYVRITADPEAGVSPLDINLTIEASFAFETSSLSYTGPGTVEVLSNPDPGEYLVRIITPGLYAFTSELMDEHMNIFEDTVMVQVMDLALLDSLLKAKWNGMKRALIDGDIQRALEYQLPVFRDKYESIYNFLGIKLSALGEQMQDIGLVFAEGNRAKYRIRRDHSIEGKVTTVTYYIYFSKDGDGLWKIERY